MFSELEIGGTVLYSNAGHPPPILVRAHGSIELLQTRGMILGPRPVVRYPIDLVSLAPGDLLALYTDGITEAVHPDTAEEYGIKRLSRILLDHRRRPAGEILERVFADVAEHSDRTAPEDDQTLLLIRRSPDEPDSTETAS